MPKRTLLQVLKLPTSSAPHSLLRRSARFATSTPRQHLARVARTPLLRHFLTHQNDGLTLGRIGNLEVRLACGATEVRLAQALRYEVFYEEMAAIPDALTKLTRRDVDQFDAICDHMLVLDHDKQVKTLTGTRPAVVGTYRLLRQSVATKRKGFYTANEFDISPILSAHKDQNFLELGRSCVLKPYRTKRTVELLWAGIWAYVQRHKIDVMIGCASLEGTDPQAHALALSFLHHHAKAPTEWSVYARSDRFVEMNRIPFQAIDMKAALSALPPLIKGYLRLGAYIGNGAVVDHQFGTTDVMIILPVSAISERYINHYSAAA